MRTYGRSAMLELPSADASMTALSVAPAAKCCMTESNVASVPTPLGATNSLLWSALGDRKTPGHLLSDINRKKQKMNDSTQARTGIKRWRNAVALALALLTLAPLMAGVGDSDSVVAAPAAAVANVLDVVGISEDTADAASRWVGAPIKSGRNAFACGNYYESTRDIDIHRWAWSWSDGSNVWREGFSCEERAMWSGTRTYRHQIHGLGSDQYRLTL